jgi:dephospho-CoA kinase
MAVQKSIEEMIERADIVVNNDGSLEDLAAQADRVWNELQERAR